MYYFFKYNMFMDLVKWIVEEKGICIIKNYYRSLNFYVMVNVILFFIVCYIYFKYL